ncbi:glycine oxidase ThiO [Pararhizobium haloflavum]|uniref:glycine oxidase ThiO n=1 Tax=Pararhizobium haloflavum TaxID=2037914 RepID=UPI000C198CBB|nr:glycine oxidase ThiO [Pararhizobium haloflavum]
MHILVKGAGVAGLVTAHELLRRGAAVTVVDAAPSLGGGASFMAGGMLAPWCERESAEEAVITLGSIAADWWDNAVPGLVLRNGTLVVAPPRDAAEIDRFARRTRGYRQVGAEEIARLEPHLSGRFSSGLFFPSEAHLDPRTALYRLHEKLARSGVTFSFGATTADGRFDAVIDCTGMAAASALPALRGVRGEMVCLQTNEVEFARPVRLIHPRFPLYVVPRGQGRFMVGATMIESDDDGPPSARSVMELLNAAYAVNPAFGEARILETGAGVRPAFADNLPRIERSGGTHHLNGLFRHGFLLAPAMAGRLADRILTNRESDNAGYRQRQIA